MNHRKFKTWIIFCLTVLSADLLAEIAVVWVSDYTKSHNPYKAAAVSMAVAIVVFFPAFQLIDLIVKKSAKKYVAKTRDAVGGGFYGLIFAFIIGLAILYGFYLKVKFGINIVEKFF